MEKFLTLDAIAAPLPINNVDTDKILAGAFLKTVTRDGLGEKLFHAMRFDETGAEKPDFILNRLPWRQAGVLVALDNFGCGSSREHAVWALRDFGIRCIVANSFADIFCGNCFKNGVLPIALSSEEVSRLMTSASDPMAAHLAIDLPLQQIRMASGVTMQFEIAPERKAALMTGEDEIELALAHLADIERWEVSNDVGASSIVIDGSAPL